MSGASKRAQLAAETGLWWLLTAGAWLVTLSTRTPAELAVMAVCTLPCAVMARSARRANAGRWTFRAGWLAWLPTVALEVIQQAGQVLAYAFSRRRRRATTTALRLPGEANPVAAARRATAVLALATTPGNVVLDCDPRKQTVLVHRVRRRLGRLETAVQR